MSSAARQPRFRTEILATVAAELVVMAENLDDHDYMIDSDERLRIAIARQWRRAGSSSERAISWASPERRL